MRQTRNTLSHEIRVQSIQLLNRHLAAAIDLHTQAKQAHWNVRGPNFIAIHGLFDAVAQESAEHADMIAERAGGLGGVAIGTLATVAEHSYLTPYPLGLANEVQHIFAISGALATFGEGVREAIGLAATFGDADTADLFTQVSRSADRQLWLVESHVPPA